MWQKIKIPVILLGISGAIYGVYWYFFVRNKQSNTSIVPTNTVRSSPVSTSSSGTPKSNCITNLNNNPTAFPISMGSKGFQVKQLQKKLNEKANPKLCADGDWGPLTQAEFEKQKINFTLGISGYVYNTKNVGFTDYQRLKLDQV